MSEAKRKAYKNVIDMIAEAIDQVDAEAIYTSEELAELQALRLRLIEELQNEPR